MKQCDENGCTIDYGEIEAKRKLDKWLKKMNFEPIDYDATGSTTREMEGTTT